MLRQRAQLGVWAGQRKLHRRLDLHPRRLLQLHGLGLVEGGSTLQPSGTALIADGSVTASPDDDSIDVQVQNQGDADESGIEVTVSGDGIDGKDTIDSIAPGATETASVPIKATAGQTVEITVDVATVPCEQVAENNTATYSVTF